MAQVVSYFTGFETGDGSETALGTGCTVQSVLKRTGGYALKIDSSGTSMVLVGGFAVSQIVVRSYFRLDNASPSGGSIYNIRDSGGTGLCVLSLVADLTLRVVSDDFSVTGTTVLAINTWYRLEVVFDVAAGGVVKLFIDGSTEINTTHTNSLGAGQIWGVEIDGDTVANWYFDDVRIDTGGVAAVGAGQTIARQGIAGTPTYDAWTKTGAATAALCWSATPFATAQRCSDNVLNDAQTMLVGLFSTDPSRAEEGTQVVDSSATINACKVAMIAKTAVAGNITMRRRVGGADTDTTKALTTSDAYYQTGFFTDTPANLDAYEIGVKNALVATTETVEDMWMMVDYTPGSFVPFPYSQIDPTSVIRRKPAMIGY